MKLLVVYHNPDPEARTRATVLDHLHAMEHSPRGHEIEYYNIQEHVPNYGLIRDDTPIVVPDVARRRWDAVLLHYTLVSLRAAGLPFYRWKAHVDWIRTLDAVKVAMPQDEGSYADVLDEWLIELGVDVVFSVHFRPHRELYPRLRRRAAIVPCFPGYIERRRARELAPTLRPLAERDVDLVYRARNLPFRIGRYGQLKHRISAIETAARAEGFRCDISTREVDTVLGSHWLEFLAHGRAVLGIQGGYSAVDWRGELAAQLERMLKTNPDLTFEAFDASLPSGWDSRDWLTITPRHFEAVVTKTAQVLVEGHYRGVLEPHRHYVPLAADLSNMQEVWDALRDVDELQAMVDRAYDDLCISERYSYRAFAIAIDEAIDDQLQRRRTAMPDPATPSPELTALQQELFSARQHNALLQQRLEDFQHTLAATVSASVAQTVQSGLAGFQESLQQSLQQLQSPTVGLERLAAAIEELRRAATLEQQARTTERRIFAATVLVLGAAVLALALTLI